MIERKVKFIERNIKVNSAVKWYNIYRFSEFYQITEKENRL